MVDKPKPASDEVRVIIRVDLPVLESQDVPEVRRAILNAVKTIPGAQVELSVLPTR